MKGGLIEAGKISLVFNLLLRTLIYFTCVGYLIYDSFQYTYPFLLLIFVSSYLYCSLPDQAHFSILT